ncbi:MAG: UDP-N-acetylmuramoyl-tripeptide--D-alanyl-D-alanine ligase [Opitutales bacterium]
MPVFDSEQLARWTGGRWHGQPETITGFGQDTRQLQAGDCFVALKTERRDGHDFLRAAQSAGASAALVSRVEVSVSLPQLEVPEVQPGFHAIAREHRQTFAKPVAGITGSAGKTSTKDLLACLLGVSTTLATRANENNLLGVPLTLTRLDAARQRAAVIEAGISEVGEMRRLADMIRPDVAIVTLVAPVHLEGLGSLEGVAREKALLPAAMAEDGRAFFPAACLRFSEFRAFGRRAVVTTDSNQEPRGKGSEQWVSYQTETEEGGGLRLAIAGAPSSLPSFRLPPVGPGMVGNAVLAILAAQHLGVSADQLQQRLADWQPSSWRAEWVTNGPRTFLADCYNASPPSMAEAFAVFAQRFPRGEAPRLFLLGCMAELGPEAARLHRETGALLKLGPDDQVWVLGEEAETLAQGIRETTTKPEQVHVADSLEELKRAAGNHTGPVLVKGSRRYGLEALLPDHSATGGPSC